MNKKFKIAVVGAGPAGLSAAAHAAVLGVSHVLLEASTDIANTVQRFQKGKLVMAEPARLPLQSPLSFAAGTREDILASWRKEIADCRVNLRTDAAVADISGQLGDFRIVLASGAELAAEAVVLAIGLQGNIRKLNVPGEDFPGVQYQLDDPEEYRDETILVIGGGDAGVENALALAKRNRVILINRQDEFTNCREANLNRLKDAVSAGWLETRTGTSVVEVERQAVGDFPLTLVTRSPQGVEHIGCQRIIARLGALPPRKTLDRFGIRFLGDDPLAPPRLSERYESNISGLYIIGALAGYPLIKQALNQGHEVVAHILGKPVEPADQQFLMAKFSRIAGLNSVAEGIDLFQRGQPLFAALTPLQLRELLFDSDVQTPRPREVIFKRNDYSNSFFSILQGTVDIHVENSQGDGAAIFTLGQGDFFGEVGLLSGRRRSGTAIAGDDCILVETPRRSMLNLLDTAPSVQHRLDEVALKRIVHTCCGESLSDAQIDRLVQNATLEEYAVGDVIFNEGDAASKLCLIRRGSVTVSRRMAGKEVILAYVAAGNYVGEMALVSKMPRTATVRAAAPTEMVVLDAERFNELLESNASLRGNVASRYLDRIRMNESATAGRDSDAIQFLVNQGIGEATDVLLIDYHRCVRCDNCETACADAHGGTSRLGRNAGRTHENIHIPGSCRHCEHPRCMKDCPADAIHRSPNGEVFISDSCIGCGNCQGNCPYGVIHLESKAGRQPTGFWQRLVGWIIPPTTPPVPGEESAKLAVKCDMCRGIIGGAACVRACPTGAAARVSPEQFLNIAGG